MPSSLYIGFIVYENYLFQISKDYYLINSSVLTIFIVSSLLRITRFRKHEARMKEVFLVETTAQKSVIAQNHQLFYFYSNSIAVLA